MVFLRRSHQHLCAATRLQQWLDTESVTWARCEFSSYIPPMSHFCRSCVISAVPVALRSKWSLHREHLINSELGYSLFLIVLNHLRCQVAAKNIIHDIYCTSTSFCYIMNFCPQLSYIWRKLQFGSSKLYIQLFLLTIKILSYNLYRRNQGYIFTYSTSVIIGCSLFLKVRFCIGTFLEVLII